MTEYDYSPDDLDLYSSTPSHITQRAGSAQRYPPPTSFVVDPSPAGYGGQGYGSEYPYRGHTSNHYPGRSYSVRSGDGFGQDMPLPYGGASSIRGAPLSETYGVNPNINPSFRNSGGLNRSAFAHSVPPGQQFSRPGSFTHHSDLPPLPIRSSIPQNNPLYPSHAYPLSHQGSRPFYPRSMERGPSNHIQVPLSPEWTNEERRYHHSPSRTSSERSYSEDSYSDYSYSSRSSSSRSSRLRSRPRSRSRPRHDYSAMHPGPTVVQASRNVPVIVPINGGVGGYVIVPPAGQSVQVVDTSKFYNQPSLIEKILSPSQWGFGKNKRRVYRL